MKLSLAWIFDHIEADWKEQDSSLIAEKFNAIVAEIENISRFKVDIDQFYLARKESESSGNISLSIPELSKTVTLKMPTGGNYLINWRAGSPAFMLKKNAQSFSWATLGDFGVEKDEVLPAFDVDDYKLQGQWRIDIETEDLLLDIDNKSLTHRPDMWCHRGFAREIAAFLDVPFLCSDDFLKKHHLVHSIECSSATATTPIVIENKESNICHRFAGLYIKSIENRPSNLVIAGRLLRVGLRPINALVDLTNYIACDWSQPMHIYDADKIGGKRVVIRKAYENEKLNLLDGKTVELSSSDLVIANGNKPMCLAGVKGGHDESVSPQTSAVFVESANFDAAAVRLASLRHKLRTDSSTRFEKTLDPNLAVEAMFRFLKLLEECNINAAIADEVVLVGIPSVQERVIEVSHKFLEKKLGCSLSEAAVVTPLTKLGFKVLESFISDATKERIYLIGVPTYRGSKDIKTKEDILEEVTRCYGYEKIPHILPPIIRTPYDTQKMMRERKIKQFLAHASKMIEFQNYAFFDEENLLALGLYEIHAQSIINPVSENYRRLITSLIPGLLKNIRENQMQRERLPIFEWGKIWPYGGNSVCEKRCLAGIFFERRNTVDFYISKAELHGLWRFLDLDEKKIVWQKIEPVPAPWYLLHQTARIMYDDQLLGYAGTINRSFLQNIDALPESNAFIFELDGDLLLSLAPVKKQYEHISRFQDTYFDVSLMVPLVVTVAQLQELFCVSPLIKKIELIDFFEKKEWVDLRSLTFRLWLSHQEKTLEKEEIDFVWKQVVSATASVGATIRTAEES
jgi:phenylalanyl-tRNA synthetase beta chain